MDNRGLAYQKHDRPSLNDKVWRLRKIANKIYKRLSSHGIETVKDLLQLYTTNEASLRQKIGNIQGKSWDKIIEHAQACEIDDDTRYIYQFFAAKPSISLVLNCIYQVVGVIFNGQNFCSLESLNLEKKCLVEIVKRQAYSNLKDVKPIEPTSPSLATMLAAVNYGAPDQGLQQFHLPIAQQGQPQMFLPYLSQPSTSTTSYINEAAQSDQVGSSPLPDQLVAMPLNWPAGEQILSGAYNNGWPDSGSQIDQLASCFVPPTPWEPLDSFYFPYDYGAESSNPFHNSAVSTSTEGKRKTVWSKIRNVLKWAILYAAKRKAKVFDYHY